MRGGRLTAGVACAAIVLAAAPARAADPTPSELAAARDLFSEGVALEHQKEWTQALVRLRKAQAIVVTPKIRFHVGVCLEHTGKLVLSIP